MVVNEAWRDRAACLGADTDLFFPETGGPNNGTSRALAICARCPVVAECREYIDRVESSPGYRTFHGVWGGATADERQDAHRRARKTEVAA
ncbi:WhiB family transcriptional regulator [Streptomyces pini]|uniref:WhiB family transcriptional regulator, redox-sensing transcriptional regulator n=1 Tax=Streptomyces pini TaxID=1520580 RepID=A0A1I4C3C9_9ACTN|nr:WhiB family transcriptional regulator [Streptomyces pini]SFK74839.1 WhiB family transcriptional regulator, redox-sensing transcriptional regulator [Streptomyces pini]